MSVFQNIYVSVNNSRNPLVVAGWSRAVMDYICVDSQSKVGSDKGYPCLILVRTYHYTNVNFLVIQALSLVSNRYLDFPFSFPMLQESLRIRIEEANEKEEREKQEEEEERGRVSIKAS